MVRMTVLVALRAGGYLGNLMSSLPRGGGSFPGAIATTLAIGARTMYFLFKMYVLKM